MKSLLLVSTLVLTSVQGCQDATGRCADSPEGAKTWEYRGSAAPDTWLREFPACGGASQSPVALVTAEALPNATFEPLKFVNYDFKPGNTFVTNTGHSLLVTQACGAAVSGGNLPGVYTFANFHFHWGANESRGSEHTLDGASSPAELHLVHYKQVHRNLKEATHHDRGIAVLSVMLKLVPQDNPVLQPIVSCLRDITRPREVTTTRTPIVLEDVLPENKDDFYRYEGSLTAPGCQEVVLWTVFREPITISPLQLQAFRRLIGADGAPIQDNFRPLQPLHGRPVYRSWK